MQKGTFACWRKQKVQAGSECNMGDEVRVGGVLVGHFGGFWPESERGGFSGALRRSVIYILTGVLLASGPW